MNFFGLIGYPLTHSFSRRYFSDKFERERIKESSYDLYEMATLDPLPALLKKPGLIGLNVTIPFKKTVLPFLDELDDASAQRIGAVNTIKVYADGSTKGFNTDYYGFKQSLTEWFDRHGEQPATFKALILGNGGAAKAVQVALQDVGIEYKLVSRQTGSDFLRYEELTEQIMQEHLLIVNTTPLGTFPNIEGCPSVPYQWVTKRHYLYDLVYNPAETVFLQHGKASGAHIQNGLKMLELQAEKAWDIWNSEEDVWAN